MSRTALTTQRVGDWVPECVLLFSLEENGDTEFSLLGGEKRTATEP